MIHVVPHPPVMTSWWLLAAMKVIPLGWLITSDSTVRERTSCHLRWLFCKVLVPMASAFVFMSPRHMRAFSVIVCDARHR